ncbi:SDR family NAD(P)-dependent oxidoreductase [Streptomyces boncukensis]|uniref:SDR family NAD(P)-dependent oxidoreductase n=1 Tax=Streptomyces boncukensis TaxID=2711219 RepID=A0A6G4WZN7_9ACTN|nr:SDR family NAD(P)-dependent oxidoreductase [Streptomyces boncukensis]NGO70759.1 SDR family NAD(P)-dependent oxidoreductase [Streptomyces boncukensis]
MRGVVITGVSRGLGEAFFRTLEEEQARLFAIGRSFTDRQFTQAQHGGQVVLHHADLNDLSQLPSASDLADFLAGADDAVLIHNAGFLDPFGAIGHLDPDQLESALRVNLLAPMALTDTFTAAVEQTGPARVRVLYVSSGAARRVIGGLAAYCTTKAGAEMYFAALAEQMRADRRWEVHCLNPGIMPTRMLDQLGSVPDAAYFPQRDTYRALSGDAGLPAPSYVAQRLLRYVLA